ncbi:MAG TPA: isochorismatase family cysteine hydrolase [Chloroflexota bacterium]
MQFPIVPARTAMLFFDALNVYLHPKDPEVKAAVEHSGVLVAMQKINQAARDAGIAVFYAQADHRPDFKDFAPHIVDRGHQQASPEPYKTTPPAAVSGSWEAEIVPELAPQSGDYVIKKHRWSSFFQTHLELSLRTAGIDTIMLAGGSTEVGIASTAYAARDLDFNLIVLRDACRSGRAGVDDFFAEQVFPVFTRVMTVDQAIAAIQ